MTHPSSPIIAALIERLRRSVPGVVAIYRFGTWGTASQRPDSDVDIAVLSDEPQPVKQLWDVSQELAVELGSEVDLVDLRRASTVFAAQVVSAGERLFCANETVCETWENYVYAAYARLNEERREIIQDIEARGSIYGR